MLVFTMLSNLGNIASLIGNFIAVISPIFYGFVIAYLLAPIVEKLEKQIVHNRTRLWKGLRQDAFRDLPIEDDEDEEEGPRIVRVKQFSVKPMSEEEAMLQLELLGHAFYVFRNVDTNEINVLYKRKDGNFGLIEPL